nr:uncharacterized protein LOC113700525 [Coffea arabica]
MFGNEVAAGMGGRATLGIVGIVGNVGFGKGGRFVGNVGKGVLDNGGNVVGKFGRVVPGNVGIAGITGGEVCNSWRAAWLSWMLENDKAMRKARKKQTLEELDGGGEKKGIEGNEVGILVGIGGIVDGIFGNEVAAGMGGRATFGTAGIVGKDGRFVGNVGKGVLDNGGNVVGKFGRVVPGNVGIAGITGGEVCNSRRAAWLSWMLENDKAMSKDRKKQTLEEVAILSTWIEYRRRKKLEIGFLDGGGEKKGIEGIDVGRLVGIEGIVNGMFGNEVAAGMGGRAPRGIVGTVGNAGFGKDGTFVGNVGRGVVGNGGNAAAPVGKFGRVGNVGIVGCEVCKSWRAASVT